MEIRQLAAFLLACQGATHGEAAQRAGLAASTLSKSLRDLEEDLGVALFRRTGTGNVPTDLARWLQLRADAVVRLAVLVERLADGGGVPAVQRLAVASPLRFMDGSLTRAARWAAAELAGRVQGVFVDLQFTHLATRPGRQTVASGEAGRRTGFADAGSVVIDYVFPERPGADHVPLCADAWLGLTNARAEPPQPLTPADLRRQLLFLPPLPSAQLIRARHWCAELGLPSPSVIPADADLADQLARQTQPFTLLAPTSFARGTLSRLGLSAQQLPQPLTSMIGALLGDGTPLARAFVALLQEALAEGSQPPVQLTRLTLRQMRYVTVMHETLNMSDAARRLHVSQPTLSSQLAKVEALLDRPLFARRQRGLAPAPAAAPLVAAIAEAVARCGEIEAEALHIVSSRNGQLVFGVVPLSNDRGPLVDALSQSLEEFVTQFPRVRVKVVEAPAATLQQGVELGRIGLALVESRVSRFSQIDLMSSDRLGIVSDPRWGLLPPGEVRLARAAELRLVLPNEIFGLRQLIDRAVEQRGLQLAPVLESNSLTLSLALLRRSPLATIMPSASVERLTATGEMAFNPITEPEISRNLSIVFNPERALTEVERGLIAILRRVLKTSWVSGRSPPAGTEPRAADDPRPARRAARSRRSE